jgi:hypothetical protein
MTQCTPRHRPPLPVDVRGCWGRRRMPLLPPLPRWVRWMEARHWMVAQTAEQSGMARGCGAAAREKGCGGRVRCLRWMALRSYAEEDKRLFFCEDTVVECMKQRAECECGASEGTDTCILSLSLIEIAYSHSRFSTSTIVFGWLF